MALPTKAKGMSPAGISNKISTKGDGSATSLSERDIAAGAKAMTMGTMNAVSKPEKRMSTMEKRSLFTPIKARKAAFLK